MKVNLLDFNRQQLKEYLVANGQQGFRAQQIFKWIYHKDELDFAAMNDLSKDLRSWLQQNCVIEAPEIAVEQIATDGCVKWAMWVGDSKIEAVYIPEENRGTLCVSSQVGCALECTFCSTAQQGFNKNLKVSQIIGQVWVANRRLKQLASLAGEQQSLSILANKTERPITNVVMMGMGEPLLNVNNLLPALDIMLDDFGYGLSKRRVTISTSGVVSALNKLAGQLDVALAISLHAPNDTLRDELVPINKRYNIKSFLDAARAYVKNSKANQGKVTVEYVMLDQVNDTLEHAQQITKILGQDECKINLIPWNPFPNAPYKSSSKNRIHAFQRYLADKGYVVTIRKTRGEDIDAACGQLAGQIIDRTRRTNSRENYSSIKNNNSDLINIKQV